MQTHRNVSKSGAGIRSLALHIKGTHPGQGWPKWKPAPSPMPKHARNRMTGGGLLPWDTWQRISEQWHLLRTGFLRWQSYKISPFPFEGLPESVNLNFFWRNYRETSLSSEDFEIENSTAILSLTKLLLHLTAPLLHTSSDSTAFPSICHLSL